MVSGFSEAACRAQPFFSPLEANRDKRALSNLSRSAAVTTARAQLKVLVFLDTCGAPWPGMCLLLPSNSRVTKIMFSPKTPPSRHATTRSHPMVHPCVNVYSDTYTCGVEHEGRRDCTAPFSGAVGLYRASRSVTSKNHSGKARAEGQKGTTIGPGAAINNGSLLCPLAKGHIRKAPSPLFVRSRGDARADCQGLTCSRLERGARTGVA